MALSMRQNLKLLAGAIRKPIIALAIINAAVAVIAFVKDIALAAYVGTTVEADALTLAFFIPDSMGNTLFAGAISVVCVPVFSRLWALKQYGQLRLIIRKVSIRFIGVSILMMSLAYLLSESITLRLGGAAGQELSSATLPLLRILLPTIVLFILVAIGTAISQSVQRFFVPAAAPLLFNFSILGGVVYCSWLGIPVQEGISRIAEAITLGVALMAVWMVVAWYKAVAGLQQIAKRSQDDYWKELMRIFVPYLVILISFQFVYMVERYLVTAFDPGSVAALNYAFRLTQFPIWVFVSAVSIVILPSISQHLALGQQKEASFVMADAFRTVVLIGLPSTLFLFFLREPLIAALFQRGAFDAFSVKLTTSILEGYSLSVFSQALSLVGLRYFLASRRLAAAFTSFAVAAIFTILLDIWLLPFMGPRGIGYGAALGALVNAIFILLILWREFRPTLKVVASEIRLYLGILVMLLLLFGAARFIWLQISTHYSMNPLIYILLAGCLFLIGYFHVLRRYWPAKINSN